MKTREQIIHDMCVTWRHDYGIIRDEQDGQLAAGVTNAERESLWRQMSQIYDNCIEPVMQPKLSDHSLWTKYQWTEL